VFKHAHAPVTFIRGSTVTATPNSPAIHMTARTASGARALLTAVVVPRPGLAPVTTRMVVTVKATANNFAIHTTA
jgi:hypothetical protein